MSSTTSHLLDGRFILDARIGEGNFAEIYRATDTQTGNLVAVKTLRPEHATKDNAIALFRQEGEIGSTLSHANVVKVWTYGETAGTFFIVMELVNGVSLRRRMRRAQPISVPEAYRIIRSVLRGLEAIHTAGYIHRDIKPQNILLEANGTPKITDFGITLRAGGIRATGDGMTLGTAAYIAPEQAAGKEIGPQADLYAAGVVLYEMLTGEVPFPGDDPIDVMYRHMFETPRDPRTLNPEISPGLSAIMLRALAKEPDARFPSAHAMLSALDMLPLDVDENAAPVWKRHINRSTTRRKPSRIAHVPFLTTFVGALLLAVLIIVLVLALVSTAVTANDSSQNTSNSDSVTGFTVKPTSDVSMPQPTIAAQIQIPLTAPSMRPPIVNVPESTPIVENSAPVIAQAATATPTATPSPTETATATATATPTPTATPKPTATPNTQLASAQVPTPSTQSDSSVSSKKPAASDNEQAASDDNASGHGHGNKKKGPPNVDNGSGNGDQAPNQSANDPNTGSNNNQNQNQSTNRGFGATQNVTNKPDSSDAPVVSNGGNNEVISGQNSGPSSNGNSSTNGSKGPDKKPGGNSGGSNKGHKKNGG